MEDAVTFERPSASRGGPGFIYVMHCPAMPDLAKVGMTTRSPWERAAELSGTGLPEPYQVTRAFAVWDALQAERRCHRELDRCRHQQNREFFKDGWFVGENGKPTSSTACLVQAILSDAGLLAESFAFNDPLTELKLAELDRLQAGDVAMLSERVRALEAEIAMVSRDRDSLAVRCTGLETTIENGKRTERLLRARLAEQGDALADAVAPWVSAA